MNEGETKGRRVKRERACWDSRASVIKRHAPDGELEGEVVWFDSVSWTFLLQLIEYIDVHFSRDSKNSQNLTCESRIGQ